MNFIFISPSFPKTYYQFPKSAKEIGIKTLGIGEDNYESLSTNLKNSLDDYYKVSSLENYEEVHKAVAFFTFKYGKIDFLESNNEYWLQLDARLRTDFNITSGAKLDELDGFKLKSQMKAFYKKAGVKVARYHMVDTIENAKKFILEVGYPVVVKPDNGVGANATYKISNELELENFYKQGVRIPYIMEEYLEGIICSYDGIVNSKSEILFETAHEYGDSIMDIVNDVKDSVYYSLKEIPEELQTIGRKVIESFKPRSRFFHTEYFILSKDKPGLASKGEIIGLEVNMRPPGGYSTDMINFANDVDVYKMYADMIKYDKTFHTTTRPYMVVFVGRRKTNSYKYSTEDVLKKYKDNICMSEIMPEVLATAMGNQMFIAKFKEQSESKSFLKYVLEKK